MGIIPRLLYECNHAFRIW